MESVTANSRTAITSCIRRKNRGASVVFKTHLLLCGEVSKPPIPSGQYVRHDHLVESSVKPEWQKITRIRTDNAATR